MLAKTNSSLTIRSTDLQAFEKVKTHLRPWEIRDIHQPGRTGVAEYGSREIYGVGSHYQVATGEDTED
jgi:hypothetical protein